MILNDDQTDAALTIAAKSAALREAPPIRPPSTSGCATRSAAFAAFFAVMTVVAMAGLWELVEWQYAVIEGGDAGAAFLGSQGDVWDAQKDILCDTLGALCASTLFLLRERKTT